MGKHYGPLTAATADRPAQSAPAPSASATAETSITVINGDCSYITPTPGASKSIVINQPSSPSLDPRVAAQGATFWAEIEAEQRGEPASAFQSGKVIVQCDKPGSKPKGPKLTP